MKLKYLTYIHRIVGEQREIFWRALRSRELEVSVNVSVGGSTKGTAQEADNGVRLSDGWSLCILCESPVSICKTEPDNIFGVNCMWEAGITGRGNCGFRVFRTFPSKLK